MHAIVVSVVTFLGATLPPAAFAWKAYIRMLNKLNEEIACRSKETENERKLSKTLRAAQAELTAQLRKKDAELQSWQRKAQQAEAMTRSEQVAGRKKLQELELGNEQLKQQITQLEQELATATHQHASAIAMQEKVFYQQLQAANAEVSILESQLEVEAQNAGMAARELQAAHAELGNKQQQLHALSHEISQVQQQYSEKDRQLQALKHSAAELELQYNCAHQERLALNLQLDEMKQMVMNKASRASELERQHSQLNGQMQESSAQLLETHSLVAELQRTLEAHDKSKEAMIDRLVATQNEATDMRARMSGLEMELSNAKKNLEEVQAELERERIDREQLCNQVKENHEKLTTLRKMNTQKHNELDSTTDALSLMRSEWETAAWERDVMLSEVEAGSTLVPKLLRTVQKLQDLQYLLLALKSLQGLEAGCSKLAEVAVRSSTEAKSCKHQLLVREEAHKQLKLDYQDLASLLKAANLEPLITPRRPPTAAVQVGSVLS